MNDFVNKLSKIEITKKNEALQKIALHASQYLTNQKQIRDRFELIEQEKQILEEDYGNALSLNEDLQY